jgi:hypothetical protein
MCLRATIFQNPEGTLWTHCILRRIEGAEDRIEEVGRWQLTIEKKLHENN